MTKASLPYLLSSFSFIAMALGCYFYFRKRSKLFIKQQLKEVERHRISCNQQKKLRLKIKTKRQDYTRYLEMSLGILKNSYTNPQSPIKEEDRVALLDLCLKQVKGLALGLWEPTHNEEVDLRKIIQSIPLLFAEQIHTPSILLEINIPPKLEATLLGEPIFMEALLISAIGKILYRVPKGGKVLISLRKRKGRLHLEIQDNGYKVSDTAAELLTNSCDLFIEDKAFEQLCHDNDILYLLTLGKNGNMNFTQLTFAAPKEAIANRNQFQESL